MSNNNDRIEEQYNRMLDFKNRNKLKINPLKTLKEWATYIIESRNGHCPCKNDRPICPCEEALSEIQDRGKCFCGKFFSPEKFKVVWGKYLKLMGEDEGSY